MQLLFIAGIVLIVDTVLTQLEGKIIFVQKRNNKILLSEHSSMITFQYNNPTAKLKLFIGWCLIDNDSILTWKKFSDKNCMKLTMENFNKLDYLVTVLEF